MTSDAYTRMLLVGDVNASKHPGGLRFLLEKAVPELQRGDLVYGNLEFPMTDRGHFVQSFNKAWEGNGCSMKPQDVEALSEAGFHVVSMANNHIMDFGPEGLLQTIDLLDSRGIAHCGGGRNLNEARKPAIVKRNQLRVAFLSYSSVFTPSFPATNERPGIATVKIDTTFRPNPKTFESPGVPPIVITTPDKEDMDALRSDIRQAKANADVVVVSWHWRSQSFRKRIPYQMECGRAAIDAGATLVIGHHPHVLQGVEVYKKGVICYSLGDFAFWNARAPDAKAHDRNSVMVDCEIDKSGIRTLSLRPLFINSEIQPEVVQESNCSNRLKALMGDSEEFGTAFVDAGDKLMLNLPQ